MRTVIRYAVLIFSMVLLICTYLYVVFWSQKWRWKFWVSGDFEDLFYLLAFTFLWGAIIKVLWRLEVRLLS